MNTRLLEAKMVENGVSVSRLSELLKIAPATFWRKKNGVSDFYRSEIQLIKTVLGLSADEVDTIFFAD